MATNRYGQIWHGNHHHIDIRFPSTEARLKFQNRFEAYHASHDHEGDIPTFKNVSSKDLKLSTGSRSPEDLIKAETDKDYRITIDGYGWNDIHEYHNPSGFSRYFWYHVPTCCVPPIIVIDREFVDSGTLQRHKLSTLFTDMPDDDFKKLCASIEANGFIDPIVRIYEGQILDGWHRYRAAQELNLIRRLKFQEWKERDEGDPAAFVLARNIERRHLTPGQRGVIVVEMHNWLEHGDVDSQRDDPLNDGSQLKTNAELAKEAGVGTATIERAKEVSRAGQSDKVIAGEKSVGEVLKEQKIRASTKTEAAIAVVKPRFQDAVEKWRSSQVERLRKFEGLPVGRTPLIESEYLKTYFELAQPRIQQNTKPTAAHYEGAIACMLDRPAAFAEQLQGRHFRRIIKEWDQSVLLQLVERFQSGHILGYPALQTDSDANAVRIRRAIRDHYGFKGKITSQSFEVLFEITEDAHAVLVQLNPKAWVREGREISWALSLLSAVKDDRSPEAGVTEAPAEDAPGMNALWAVFNKRYPKWKAKYAESGYKENELIQASTEAELLDALRVYRESDRKGMPTADEVKDMTDLMRQQSYPFARCLRDLLRAKGIRDWTQQHQQTLESVQAFKERLKAFGADDDLVDETLHFYQGIAESELSTSSRETLMQLNGFLQGFIEKPLPEWPEWIRNQVPQGDEAGFLGIDIHAMRNTLASLLETLGIDDSNRNLQELLGGDLLDVFLQYKELPTAKEQLIALLNTADAILSEIEA